MNANKYLFSLDGIATETYLNKKEYYCNFNEINKAFKQYIDILPDAGIFHIENAFEKTTGIMGDISVANKMGEIGSTRISLDPIDTQNYRWFTENPEMIEFLNDRAKEKSKFNPNIFHKVHKVKSSFLNTKEFNKTEYSLFFEKPFFIRFASKELSIALDRDVFLKKKKLKKYKLYRIKLRCANESIRDTLSNDKYIRKHITKSQNSFDITYYGITKRDVFQRFMEHKKSAEDNQGYFFHKIWNAYSKIVGSKSSITLDVIKDSDTLDEIYDYEEAFVDYDSLYPMGCNSIPGGHAGIEELHKLNLLGSTKNVSLKERDKAIQMFVRKGYKIENRKLPKPHNRDGHERVYRNEDGSIRKKIKIEECKVKGGALS